MDAIDRIGPFVPALPAFVLLVVLSAAKLPQWFVILAFIAALIGGPTMVQQPVRDKKFFVFIEKVKDEKGHMVKRIQTLAIEGWSEAGENTRKFGLHWTTKLANPRLGKVPSFYGTGMNFNIEDLRFDKGEGDYLGFPLESGNFAFVIAEEILTDSDVTKHKRIPKYWLTWVDKIFLEMEQSIGI